MADPADPEGMEASRAVHHELRDLDQRRRGLLTQALLMAISGVGLVLGAGGLDAAPLDLRFLFLAATGLFSLAAIHWVDETVSMLHVECPRCAERFFGVAPETIPSPLRSRCSACGLTLSAPSPTDG